MIGLVTYERQPVLTDDDRPLIGALAEIGLDAEPVCWDDRTADWTAYQALVLRSTWDYHLRVPEFDAWLSTIERAGVPLWNPVPLVRWNMHKSYLRELQRDGVLIPATRWLTQGTRTSLSAVMREAGWTEAIVKPAISASATDTARVRIDSEADAAAFAELLARADVLVQEIVPEVVRDGEWSLIYIGGAYSHSTLKKPMAGDFRVQQELGGSAVAAVAPSMVVTAGERVTAHLPGPWLYARIDGVMTSRGFMLMEIECIEPVLFFGHAPGSYERFASALQQLLR